MPVPSNPLPDDVLAALQAGNKIEAIRRLREATGLGLKESKDAIDAHEAGRASQPAADGPLPPQALEALRRGDKVQAIRLLRERTGLGLKEAKDRVDAFRHEAQSAGHAGAPGEVPRSRHRVAWIVIGAVAVLVACYLFQAPGQ
jgi:ribosomal protein L7/L12